MREPGYYWVNEDGCWTIYFWEPDSNVFFRGGSEDKPESYFDEIDEREIVRQPICKDNQFKGAKLHVWDKDGNHIGTIKCDPD